MHHEGADIVTAIGLSVIAGAVLGLVSRSLRQPLILGYVLGGVLLGKHLGFGFITDEAEIETISAVGLILLLYIIGLEISVPKLMQMGRTVLYAGFAQFLICLGLGLGLYKATGYTGGAQFDTLYLAVCLGLSSTMIVVKLLYDKFETDTVAGRITIGILVMQDVWAIIFLALQPNLTSPEIAVIVKSFGMGALLVLAAFAISAKVLSPLFERISKTPELVLVVSIAWCFLVAKAASAVGLSKEMGALVAGMSVAAFPYNIDVAAKLIGVRDFFVTLFFVALGMKIRRPDAAMLAWAGGSVLFVVVARFISVWPVMRYLGTGNRLGFVVSLNLAQVSEFSLVIAALGLSYGHLSQQTNDIILLMMLTSAVLSTYLIIYNGPISSWIDKEFKRLGLRSGAEPEEAAHGEGEGEGGGGGGHGAHGKEIAVLGYFREAQALLDLIAKDAPEMNRKLVVVDYNAKVLKELQGRGLTAMYGDIANPETLAEAGLGGCRMVICTLSDTFLKGTDNLSLVRSLRRMFPKIRIVVLAESDAQSEDLLKAGAQAVVRPAMLVGREFLDSIRRMA